jgi:hypothetical protein
LYKKVDHKKQWLVASGQVVLRAALLKPVWLSH